MKTKLTLLLLSLFLSIGAWSTTYTVKVAAYDEIQPWANAGAYITRSADKLTLTTTDYSGLAGLTVVSNGTSSAGFWDKPSSGYPWLLLDPGTTSEVTYTITINAPTGYKIKSYSIECYRWNANRTYVVTDQDGSTTQTLSTNNGYNFSVSSLTDDSHYFTVKGESTGTSNVYFAIKNMTVTLEPATPVTVTYTCENLSGYQLVGSTNYDIPSGGKFTPPTVSGYTFDSAYDSEVLFDCANTTISSNKTLTLKYRLTTNPLESNKSTVAAPTWCTIRIGTGSGKEYLQPNESDAPFILFSGTTIAYPIADKYLWCIEGDETNGYMLYNKAKKQYLGRTDAYYGSTTTAYKLALVDDAPGNNPRWTFVYSSGGYRLYSVTDNSAVNRSGTTPHYWTSGMMFYTNEVDDALTLYQTNYPYSTIVNTAGYVGGYEPTNVFSATTAVSNTEPTTVDSYASFVTPLGSKIPLEVGYYRFVSAMPGFKSNQGVNKALTIYSGNTNYPGWETYDANSEKQIFHLTYESSAWHLQNVKNGKYLVVPNEYNWITFGDIGSDLTLWNFGSSMYSVGLNNQRAIHAYNHNSGVVEDGKGNENMLVAYANNEYPSLWYLEKVATITMISPSKVEAGNDVYMSYANNTGSDKQMPSDVTVYKVLTGGSKAEVNMTEVTSKVVPSGTGVVLKAKKGATIPLLSTSVSETLEGNMLIAGDGTGHSGYILAYKKDGDGTPKFYHMTNFELSNNKAYLPESYFSAGVKEVKLIFDFDEVDAINEIENVNLQDLDIYDLSGRKVVNSKRGIYVIKGRKFYVK